MTKQQAEMIFRTFSEMYSAAESKELDTVKDDFMFHLIHGFTEIETLCKALKDVDEHTASICAKALFRFFHDGLTHLTVARHLVLQDVFKADP